MFAQNKKIMSEAIFHVHNNDHYIMLDIILPSTERSNGEVFLYDYLNKGVNKNNLRAKMWSAKIFVIFY